MSNKKMWLIRWAEFTGDELRFILFMGFHCGLRKNEIIEARPFWFDLEKERGMLHLRKTETTDFKVAHERAELVGHFSIGGTGIGGLA